MAVSLVVVPMASCTVAGMIWIWLTVRSTAEIVVWPVTPCTVAVTVASPASMAVAFPLSSTLNTVGLLLCQLAWVDTSLVVSSERVAMACSCRVSPLANLVVGGMMETLVAMASVMVRVEILLVTP
ncbi:hypothetical protein D3C84_444030 [compost metagenome]